MKERKIVKLRELTKSRDGAGVELRRIFHREDTFDMNPFILLDLFDSKNPDDYTNGFPMHPHRGIETFTYLVEGDIVHTDSLGNSGRINSGDYQWMSAGSGIMHEEMPQPVDHMMGLQLWINLSRKNKMGIPSYLEMTKDTIPVYTENGTTVKVLSGKFKGVKQEKDPKNHPVEIYHIDLKKGSSIQIPVAEEHNSFLAVLSGGAKVADTDVADKTAVLLRDGNVVTVSSPDFDSHILFFAGEPINEPIVLGGPVVMNTKEEVDIAFEELRNGTFIKHEIGMD